MTGIHRLLTFILTGFFYLLPAYVVWAQKVDLPLQHLSEGLSHNNVRAICQDKEGYLWVGTFNGLNRYNGLGFENFFYDPKNPNSLPHNTINKIIEDRQGALWIATEQGGLARFEPNYQGFRVWNEDKEPGQQILDNQVTDLYEDYAGNLWIATNKGLNYLGPDREKVYSLSASFPPQYQKDSPVYAVLEDKLGKLWIAKEEGLFMYFPQEKKIRALKDRSSQLVQAGIAREMLIDKKGTVWIASDNQGVFMVQEIAQGEVDYHQFTHDEEDQKSLGSNRVLALMMDHRGRIWLGLENGGVHLYNPEEKNFYRYESDPRDPLTLRNNSVWELYEDQEHRLWAGTFNQGLSVYDVNFRKFSHIKQNPLQEDGLQQNSVTAFLETDEGKVWIATDGGGVTVWDRKRNVFKTYQHDPQDPQSLSSNAVLKIMQDTKGQIWLVVFGGALNRYDPIEDRFVHYNYQGEKLYDDSFDEQFGLGEDSQGRIWVAPKGWGVAYWDPIDQSFKVLPVDEKGQKGVFTPSTSTLLVDSRDNIWVGGWDSGLSRIIPQKDGKFLYKFYKADPDKPKRLSHGLSNQIYEDQKGRIWVATKSKLNLFDHESQTFRSFGKADGLLNEFINAIVQDKTGTYWVTSNKGLFKMTETDEGQFEFRRYDQNDGLQGDVFLRGSSYLGPSNTVYVGGSNGFNYFQPEAVALDTNGCSVVLTGLKIFNRAVEVGMEQSPLSAHISQAAEITLNYDQTVFTIEYIGLNLTHSEKNSYAYRLVGFDKDWNTVGSQRAATYTNLDAGTYVFEVKAANHDEVWSKKITSIKIRVLPPWWEAWWFRAILAIMIILTAYSFYHYRVNQLRKNQVILEKKVLERTRELYEKNAEVQAQAEELFQQTEELASQRDYIETKSEEISLKNQQINHSLNAAFTIQHAILPHTKQLDHTLKEYYVLYRPKDVVSGDFYWLTTVEKPSEDTPTHFMAAVDCTGHGIPGAFMTLIGNRSLDKIVKGLHLYAPSEILYRLHKEIRQLLRQEDTHNNFGMDMALLSWRQVDDESFKITFCGAKNDLYYISSQDNALKKLKGDRRAIGGEQNESIPFTDQELHLPKGSMVYLGTDGLEDQNDPKRKRFGRKSLEDLLISHHQKPLHEQQEILEEALDKHKLGSPQRDDILWMGFRLGV